MRPQRKKKEPINLWPHVTDYKLIYANVLYLYKVFCSQRTQQQTNIIETSNSQWIFGEPRLIQERRFIQICESKLMYP